MVGDRNLTIAIPQNTTPGLVSLALQAAHGEGVREHFSLAQRPVLDDHVPFLEAGMPAVNLMDFQYGSAPGLNDYWHTALDTTDKLSPESLGTMGRVTIRLLDLVARNPPVQ
jgi:Zn-dependent M28 family amino/carboxypeptidase